MRKTVNLTERGRETTILNVGRIESYMQEYADGSNQLVLLVSRADHDDQRQTYFPDGWYSVEPMTVLDDRN